MKNKNRRNISLQITSKSIKIFFILCSFLYLGQIKAQNWNQIIKVSAGDRLTKNSNARYLNDNYGYTVAIDGNYAVVGANQESEDTTEGKTLAKSGSAFVLFNNGGSWMQVKKLTASKRTGQSYFGSSVSISGDYIIVGCPYDNGDANDQNYMQGSGSAYIFKKDQGGINNWGQIQKITAKSRDKDNHFGISVGISGEYAIVGAYMDDYDTNQLKFLSESGSACIFKKDSGSSNNWRQVKKITEAFRHSNDRFGCSVAISGGYAIVGAYGNERDDKDSNILLKAGASYIFKESMGGTGNWGLVKKIISPKRNGSDFFGWSVAISGDNVIVGAYQEDEDANETNTLNESGSAYLFSKNKGGTDNWGLVKKIVASTRASGDYFGYSVSISNGYVVIGAYQEDENSSESVTLSASGSAYIYKQNQGGNDNWGQVKKITASDREQDDNFGYSVAVSNGISIAGAWLEDEDENSKNRVSAAGSAYIFKFDQGGNDNWGQTQKVVMIGQITDDRYGFSVSIDSNYAIVGAALDDEDQNGLNSLSNAGSAYVLKNINGNWKEIKKITAPVRETENAFGWAVSISGDYMIVGAPGDNRDSIENSSNPTQTGSAYIFKKDYGGSDNWGFLTKITLPSVLMKTGDRFGTAVSICGEYAIAGVPGDDEDNKEVNQIVEAGSAYIFKKDQGGTDRWGIIKKITAINRGQGDYLGSSVSITQGYAIVGAYTEDEDSTDNNTVADAGSAYIYKQDNGGTDNWGQIKKITGSKRSTGDNFGGAVAINGQYVIVGSSNESYDSSDKNAIPNSGSAYIFGKSKGGADNWGLVKKITASKRAIADNFGYSVSINGSYALVGAYSEDQSSFEIDSLSNSGSSYVFKQSLGGADKWGQMKKITASKRGAGDNFGNAVCISGEHLIVGALYDSDDSTESTQLSAAGSVYIFKYGCIPITAKVGQDQTICSGSSVTIGASAVQGNTYSWKSNPSGFNSAISNPAVTPLITTKYYLTEDYSGCYKTDSVTVFVTPSPDITTSKSGSTITANQIGATYQWLDCDNGNSIINNATTKSYTPLKSGNYSVKITLNNCIDTSTCTKIIFGDIEKASPKSFQLYIYPNPNNGLFIIQSNLKGDYCIINEMGQTMKQFQLNNDNNYQINLAELNDGIYYIVGYFGNQITTAKIVVIK